MIQRRSNHSIALAERVVLVVSQVAADSIFLGAREGAAMQATWVICSKTSFQGGSAAAVDGEHKAKTAVSPLTLICVMSLKKRLYNSG